MSRAVGAETTATFTWPTGVRKTGAFVRSTSGPSSRIWHVAIWALRVHPSFIGAALAVHLRCLGSEVSETRQSGAAEVNRSFLRHTAIPAVAVLTMGLALTGCGDKNNTRSAASGDGGGTLNGGGSTAQAVAEQTWRANYQKQNGGTINYEEVGSGTGVENFISQAYQFAGSDAYLAADQLS